MIALAYIMFLISILGFIYSILYTPDDASTPPPAPPMTSWIGKECPVGCTCFPGEGAGKQQCGYLSNDVKFTCPADCCTPSC